MEERMQKEMVKQKENDQSEGRTKRNDGCRQETDEMQSKDELLLSLLNILSAPTSVIFELKDVEDTDRPKTTSTRSTLTLKPLPKIDPKDKGKKKIEEEDETESEDDDIPQVVKKFKQIGD
ncbi:hypothetical protein Tco_0602112 [Tanacetum coccineum]